MGQAGGTGDGENRWMNHQHAIKRLWRKSIFPKPFYFVPFFARHLSSHAILFAVFYEDAQEYLLVIRHDLHQLKTNMKQIGFNFIHLAPF